MMTVIRTQPGAMERSIEEYRSGRDSESILAQMR